MTLEHLDGTLATIETQCDKFGSQATITTLIYRVVRESNDPENDLRAILQFPANPPRSTDDSQIAGLR